MSDPKKTQPEKPDMTWREVVGYLGVAAAVIIAINLPRIRRAYYGNYENVWLIGYGLFAVAALFGYLWFERKMAPLDAEVRKLRPLWNPSAGILAGVSIRHGIRIYVPDAARLGHCQILAATGRGKTMSTIEPWLLRDLKRGCSALLMDGKGDPEFVARIQRAIRQLGLPHRVTVFDLGNPKTSATTNPLAWGSPQQITDRLFTIFEFEDAFYRAVQYRVTGQITALLAAAQTGGNPVRTGITFRQIYDCLVSPDHLSEAIQRCKDPRLAAQATRLLHQDPRERDKQLAGLISQLEPLAVGEVSPLLNGEVPGREFQTVSQVVLETDRPELFICLIPTLKYQAIGQQIGKCLLQELAWAIGERSSQSGANYPFTPVYLDEFSAFVYPGFHQILNKARSSQIAFHLSHQSLGDFSIVEPELGTILHTNTNVKCLMGLNDPTTADFFAKHLGTSTEEKLTERGRKAGLFGGREKTGELSIREVEAYRIHPNRLKNYTRGMGVLHLPTEHGNVTEEIQFQALCAADLEREEGAS